ncbi:MAG: type II secretion system protein, partial [Candidatus Omnitrophica bacterium]|nr:type II secretion system protein [Candidatus Omnitrophota bacterium]
MKHRRKKSLTGFTYIEMLVVVTLMALCFVPLLQMFTESMTQVGQYSELGTALQLGREAMEGVKNLRLTEAQIEAQGVVWFPPEKEPPLEMNHETW